MCASNDDGGSTSAGAGDYVQLVASPATETSAAAVASTGDRRVVLFAPVLVTSSVKPAVVLARPGLLGEAALDFVELGEPAGGLSLSSFHSLQGSRLRSGGIR